MIYPDDTEQALFDMTKERNALAAACEGLVDEVGRLRAQLAREAQDAADAREALMGEHEHEAAALRWLCAEGGSLIAHVENAAKCLAKVQHALGLPDDQRFLQDAASDAVYALQRERDNARAEAEASRKLMVDALTAVVPAHAGGLT